MNISKRSLRLIYVGLSLISVFSILFLRGMQGPARGPRLSQTQWCAGSVLPVTKFKKGNKWVKYAVLSREAGGKDKGTWDDFGGAKEAKDGHPVVSSAREFWEEAILKDTLGWSMKHAQNYIDIAKTGHTSHILATKCRANSPKYLVQYITNFDNSLINGIRSNFTRKRNQQNQWKFKEKDRIAVVRWNDLKRVINNAGNNSFNVKVWARVTDPATGRDRKRRELITLRPVLVKKLRGLFQNRRYAQGRDAKIRYYN